MAQVDFTQSNRHKAQFSMEGVSYGPPDGAPDWESYAIWAELIEELHNVNELCCLARALAVS